MIDKTMLLIAVLLAFFLGIAAEKAVVHMNEKRSRQRHRQRAERRAQRQAAEDRRAARADEMQRRVGE